MDYTLNGAIYTDFEWLLIKTQISKVHRVNTTRPLQGVATNWSEFIGKDEWPPNSPDLNPLDYHVWGAMLERYKSFQPKPQNTGELKKVLQLIWDLQLPWLDQQSHTELHEKTWGLCESWCWTLRTHAKMNYLSDFGICNNSQCFLTMKIRPTSCCWLFRAELKIWHRIFIQP